MLKYVNYSGGIKMNELRGSNRTGFMMVNIARNKIISYFLIVLIFMSSFSLNIVSAQEIIPDGNTATNLNVHGNITDIRTGTISQNTGFNSFDLFNVDTGNIVNLYLPSSTENLLNTVNMDVSYLNGTINSILNGDIGGHVYFLNPHGIMLGSGGTINVGSLTAITPVANYMDSIFISPGNPSGSALTEIINTDLPINDTGLISIAGKINAINDINLIANNINLNNTGIISTGAVYTPGNNVNNDRVNFSDVVNVKGVEMGQEIALENGDIVIY